MLITVIQNITDIYAYSFLYSSSCGVFHYTHEATYESVF